MEALYYSLDPHDWAFLFDLVGDLEGEVIDWTR